MIVNCPVCQSPDTDVIETRKSADGKVVRRRHNCHACLARYTSKAEVEPGSIDTTRSVSPVVAGATRSVSPDKPHATRSVTPPTGSVGGVGGGLSSGSGQKPIRPDKDPDPISSLLGKPRAHARSSVGATALVTGHYLKTVFAEVRSECLPDSLPWTTPSVAGGKESAMAEAINAAIAKDPAVTADIAPTMRLLFKLAKERKAGDRSAEIEASASFAFGAWCAKFTELRERLRGVVPIATAAAGGNYRKL